MWLAYLSKGEEDRGDASVGQVTGLPASGRADLAVQELGYTTGRWAVSGRGGPDASGRGKRIWTLTVLDRTLRLQRPVSLAGASGQHLAVEI